MKSSLESGKTLYQSDKKYVENLLAQRLGNQPKEITGLKEKNENVITSRFSQPKENPGLKEKPQDVFTHRFSAKYMGGHKLFPKSRDVKVEILQDRLFVTEIDLEVPYSAITSIENVNEEKITAMRVMIFGLGALWMKKKNLYTVIQLKDELGSEQSLVFDFGKNIEEAQPTIYQRVVRARKKQ